MAFPSYVTTLPDIDFFFSGLLPRFEVVESTSSCLPTPLLMPSKTGPPVFFFVLFCFLSFFEARCRCPTFTQCPFRGELGHRSAYSSVAGGWGRVLRRAPGRRASARRGCHPFLRWDRFTPAALLSAEVNYAIVSRRRLRGSDFPA